MACLAEIFGDTDAVAATRALFGELLVKQKLTQNWREHAAAK